MKRKQEHRRGTHAQLQTSPASVDLWKCTKRSGRRAKRGDSAGGAESCKCEQECGVGGRGVGGVQLMGQSVCCVWQQFTSLQRTVCGNTHATIFGGTHLQARISVGALIEQKCHIDDGNGECHRLQEAFVTLRQRDNSQAHHMLAATTRTSIVRSNRIDKRMDNYLHVSLNIFS